MKNIDVDKFKQDTHSLQKKMAEQKMEKYQQSRVVEKQNKTAKLLDTVNQAFKQD